MDVTRESIIKVLRDTEYLLNPTQKAVSLPIINRIYKKMKHKLLFPAIHVSRNNNIINGHHRYISCLLSNFKLEMADNYSEPSDLNVFTWETVDIVDIDYDEPDDIKELNKQDAVYNNMKIEDIESIIA